MLLSYGIYIDYRGRAAPGIGVFKFSLEYTNPGLTNEGENAVNHVSR